MNKNKTGEPNKDETSDKPEAQSTLTKWTEKDGTVIWDNDDTKDKANVNKTKESAEKNKKENKNKKKEQSSQDGIQGEPVGESTSKASTGEASDNGRGTVKTPGDANS